MKPRFSLLLILLAASAAPPGAAHEGGPGFHHLSVDVRELNATESRSYALESDEGPFREGWVFIVYGGTEGPGRVIVNLTHANRTVTQWQWGAGSFHKNTTRLPATGGYNLTLWNPSDARVRYAFYFDQSCNCQSKVIPLPGGFVLFNYDFPAGRDAFVGFPTLPGWHLQGAVATLREGTEAHWPQDFEILVEQEARDRGWINFTFKTPTTTRYYVFMEALAGASLENPVELTPLVEATAHRAPAPGSIFIIVAASIAALVQRRNA